MDELENFRALLEAEQVRGLIRDGFNPDHHPHVVKIKLGRKYANIDTGCRLMVFDDGERLTGSGRYMVELATGKIYGIKSYGVINRGQQFGTVRTLDEWDWSGYLAVRKQPRAA